MLKPEVSLPVGMATAAVVYGIYSAGLPPVADVRTANEDHADVQAAERAAAWQAAAVVAGVSLIAKDTTIFILGAAAIVTLSWWYRHADMVIPEISRAIPDFGGEPEQVQPEGTAAAEYARGF